MYDNNTLYYLNQLGIVPWVLRDDISKKSAVNQLAQATQNCDQCGAYQPTFAEGDIDAPLMIIGEQVFSDKSQKLLRNMLRSIGLSEKSVFFSSTTQCQEHFAQQIQVHMPHIILAFGDAATKRASSCQDSCVIASHHPETLLANPTLKKQAYADFQQLMLKLSEHIT